MNIIQLHKMVMEAKGANYPHIGSLDLKSYEKEESGFCEVNPQINSFALESPENLIEVIIFVVATQLVRWPDVVAKFPHLMTHLVANDGMFNKNKQKSEEGKEEKDFPLFGEIVRGKTKGIDDLWKSRHGIYSSLSPLIEDYNNSKSANKEAAAFKLYVRLLGLPRLGLPKAGFAAQLLIGRYGCIDSINSNILEIPKELISVDSEGNSGFKSIGKQKDKDTGQLTGDITKGSVELAKKYADYLNTLEKLINDDISKILWDNWCDIVAHKINNPSTKFDVNLQSGLRGGTVESDYRKNYAKDSGSALYVSRFQGNITGRDVSKQHHPDNLRVTLKEIVKREIRRLLKRK
jgi:hypothetical protein